jgi:hypothetical protein
MKPHTGRTEGIYVRVKPEVRKLITEKLTKENFNVSEYFEERFLMDHMPSLKKLQEEKEMHLELAATCDKRIAELNINEIEEKKLILSQKELRHLVIACDPKWTVKRQWGLFCMAAKKKFTLEEFIKLKQKYMDKMYISL